MRTGKSENNQKLDASERPCGGSVVELPHMFSHHVAPPPPQGFLPIMAINFALQVLGGRFIC